MLMIAKFLRAIIGDEKFYGQEYKIDLDTKRASWVARYKPVGSGVGDYFCAIHYFLVYVAGDTTLVATRVTPLNWRGHQTCIQHPDLMSSWLVKRSQLDKSANDNAAMLIPVTNLRSTCMHIVNPQEIFEGIQPAHIVEYVYKCK